MADADPFAAPAEVYLARVQRAHKLMTEGLAILDELRLFRAGAHLSMAIDDLERHQGDLIGGVLREQSCPLELFR
jgi:hypothetical protein